MPSREIEENKDLFCITVVEMSTCLSHWRICDGRNRTVHMVAKQGTGVGGLMALGNLVAKQGSWECCLLCKLPLVLSAFLA